MNVPTCHEIPVSNVKSVSIQNKLPIQVLVHNTSEFGVSTCIQAYDWFKKPVPLYVAFFRRNPAGEQRVTLIPLLSYGKRGLHGVSEIGLLQKAECNQARQDSVK